LTIAVIDLCQKPTRPGFGPALKRLVNFQAWPVARRPTSFRAPLFAARGVAAAAPRWLRHVGPGRADRRWADYNHGKWCQSFLS